MSLNRPLRLIELFGGIGTQAMALRDLGCTFERYRLVEFDKHCIASYNAIHGTHFEVTDIRTLHGSDLGVVDVDDWCYLMTYSFPCTDLSTQGAMRGMSRADWESRKSTRSGLLWEVERLLNELPDDRLPDILVMENVTQVHSSKNINDFDSWRGYLRKRGYQNFCADLDALDYNVPQHRERCFMVSIRADVPIGFKFPGKIPLERVTVDCLEDDADASYYMTRDTAKAMYHELVKAGLVGEHEHTCIPRYLGNCCGYKHGSGFDGSVFDSYAPMKTLVRSCGGIPYVADDKGIRKLTPRECWRLMGFHDYDFDKAAGVCSKTQLYHQAGNAIVEPVLMAVFRQLFIALALFKVGGCYATEDIHTER